MNRDPSQLPFSVDHAGWHTVRRFLPYLWPRDRPELRRRIAGAIVFVVLAKIVVLVLPFAAVGGMITSPAMPMRTRSPVSAATTR